MRNVFCAVAALAALAVTPSPAAEVNVGQLAIDAAWSRPGMPARPAAAYMEISNSGETADRLVAARAPAFGKVELHTVEMTDGVMKMRPVESIEIPAGETVMLAPGGFHLMLFGAETPFTEGENFELTLVFAEAGEATVEVAVERRAGGGMEH